MVTRKARYQHETKALQKNTNMLLSQINCFVIYLNHIIVSIAARQHANLHPNAKPSEANKERKECRYIKPHSALALMTVSKFCCPCQHYYLLPLFAFFHLQSSQKELK